MHVLIGGACNPPYFVYHMLLGRQRLLFWLCLLVGNSLGSVHESMTTYGTELGIVRLRRHFFFGFNVARDDSTKNLAFRSCL